MMGIFIAISINPFAIEPSKWKAAYEEAMLISNYEGLAYIKRKNYNQIEVPCLACSNPVKVDVDTKYEDVKHYLEENPDVNLMRWDCMGDIYTGSNMENFELYDNIEYYRYSCKNRMFSRNNIDMDKVLSVEMLFEDLCFDSDENAYINYDKGISCVMQGKTQGEYGHMGVLEMGCLLADRFPEAVAVQGDIDYEQCVEAVKRVNKILDKSIKLPARYDYVVVFERLTRVVKDRCDLLRLLDNIYDGPKFQEYYDFVKQNFTEKEMVRYHMKQYGDDKAELLKKWSEWKELLETADRSKLQGLNENQEESHNENESKERYDHANYSTLFYWKQGDTVHPKLEENLLCGIGRFREFGELHINEYAEKYKYLGGTLTELSDFTEFISKSSTHTRLFKESDLDKILSAEFPRDSTLGNVIIGLYFVKLDYWTGLIVRAFCLNHKLLECYVNKWENHS